MNLKPLLRRDDTTAELLNMWDYNDGVNITTSRTQVKNNTFIDFFNKLYYIKSHRDAIQIIPERFDIPYATRYCADFLKGVYIENNHIFSQNHLQGIFSSDGVVFDAVIRNNMIKTISPHKISICGLMSGFVDNNFDEHNVPVRVLCDGLRIGGNSGDAGNDYIIDFHGANVDYEKILGNNTTNTDLFIDNRRGELHRKKSDRYWHSFKWADFVERCNLEKPTPNKAKEILSSYAIQDI